MLQNSSEANDRARPFDPNLSEHVRELSELLLRRKYVGGRRLPVEGVRQGIEQSLGYRLSPKQFKRALRWSEEHGIIARDKRGISLSCTRVPKGKAA